MASYAFIKIGTLALDLAAGPQTAFGTVDVNCALASFAHPASPEGTMKRLDLAIAGVALAIALSAYGDQTMKHSNAVFVNPSDLKWAEAPPDLPKGMRVAILYGDPFKPGQYAMRLEMPDGYKIPPHWHTHDEQLTIMQGTFVLHLGDTMQAEAHPLETGGFHFLPAKMHHSAEAKGPAIVQVQGTGPFDIHYLNPADNPNPKSASR